MAMRRVAVATMAVGVLACGAGGSSDAGSGACFEIRGGMCTESSGVSNLSEVEGRCDEDPLLGVWIPSCPASGRIAACAQAGGALQTVWYAGAPACVAPPDASDCAGGVFTAGATTCDGAPSVQTFACDHRARDRRCTDFAMIMEPNLRPALEALCTEGLGGTVTDAACPTEGRVATCAYVPAIPHADPDLLERHYATGSGDAARCAVRGGAWAAD